VNDLISAYHEAGHVVVATKLCYRADHVAVGEHAEKRNLAGYVQWLWDSEKSFQDHIRDEVFALNLMTMSLAGPHAEMRMLSRSREFGARIDGDGTDWRHVRKYAQLCYGKARPRNLVRDVWLSAGLLVDRYWDAITQVALDLNQAKLLDGRRVESIVTAVEQEALRPRRAKSEKGEP